MPNRLSLPSSFWALNFSQFLGALNDNAYRYVMALALMTRASEPGKLNEMPFQIAGLLFALPFILFSSNSGVLSDRLSKRSLVVRCNLAEVFVMGLGLVAFLLNAPLLIYTTLFLMVTQSAFFGPNKLGILPEMLPREKLAAANGLMALFVWVAIILGMLLGTELYGRFALNIPGASTASCWRASLVCLFIALVGFLLSLGIADTGPRHGKGRLHFQFWRETLQALRIARQRPGLMYALGVTAWFFLLGAAAQVNLVPFGIKEMALGKVAAGRLFVPLLLGMGAGSWMAGSLAPRTRELALVPLGALFLGLGLVSLNFLTDFYGVLALLVVMGLGGGFMIVPLNTFIQARAPEDQRGEIIAAGNVLNSCAIVLAALIIMALGALDFNPAQRFALLGGLTLGLLLLGLFRKWKGFPSARE